MVVERLLQLACTPANRRFDEGAFASSDILPSYSVITDLLSNIRNAAGPFTSIQIERWSIICRQHNISTYALERLMQLVDGD